MWNAFLGQLGSLLLLLGSSSFLFWFVAGGVATIHFANARLDLHLGTCQVPQDSFECTNVFILVAKPMILRSRLFAHCGRQQPPSVHNVTLAPPQTDPQATGRHRALQVVPKSPSRIIGGPRCASKRLHPLPVCRFCPLWAPKGLHKHPKHPPKPPPKTLPGPQKPPQDNHRPTKAVSRTPLPYNLPYKTAWRNARKRLNSPGHRPSGVLRSSASSLWFIGLYRSYLKASLRGLPTEK